MSVNTKKRISMMTHAKARALSELRQACVVAMSGRPTISLKVDVEPGSAYHRVIATDSVSLERIEHPVSWAMPYSVMVKEMCSLAKALEVEANIEAANKLNRKKWPQL